jgi:hemoglobin-like flavoprotein
MTPQQIKLVQDSFKLVVPIKEQAASLFYGRLFESNPKLRGLFSGDMAEQGRKLMMVLATVVGGLNRLDQIVPAVRDLGRKHASYGVTDDHYPLVGAALLWTLSQGLGERFTADVAEAWTAAYSLLAEVMKEAAHQAGLAARPEPALV